MLSSENDRASLLLPSRLWRTNEYSADSLYSSGEASSVCSGCLARRASMNGRSLYDLPRSLSCFLVALMMAVKLIRLKPSSSLTSLVTLSSSARTSFSSFSRSSWLGSGCFLSPSFAASENRPSPSLLLSLWPSLPSLPSLSSAFRPTANGSSFFSQAEVRSRSFWETSRMKPCTFSSCTLASSSTKALSSSAVQLSSSSLSLSSFFSLS